MRIKKYLFFAMVLIMMILMSAVAYFRNKNCLVEKFVVNFESQGPHFLSYSLVDKLLIQNKGELPWKGKDSLVLNMLESSLEKNPYIDIAEVYHFKKGILGVNIQEKKPVVRIQSSDQYYLDKEGNQFPISNNYTPKVPLFMGILQEDNKKDLLLLIKHLNKDAFLKNELAYIHFRSNSYFIGLRSYAFEVEIGQVRFLDEKISKLKVFCAYHDINKMKSEYNLINLKFKNQVVGS